MGTYTIPNVVERTPQGERSYDVFSRLLSERIIFLGTEIDDGVANVVIAQLLHLESSAPESEIAVYINSPGGSFTSLMAIYDTMAFVQAPISTYCVGQAASTAAVLLAGGAPGRRQILRHGRVVLHAPAAEGRGTIPVVIEQRPTGERASDVYSRLLTDRIIFLGTEIDDGVANVVIAQLLHLQSESQDSPIHLYINSPGGSITALLAVYDTMQYIKPTVATFCLGQAASAAAVLLAAGTPGNRHVLEHARVLLHQPSGGGEGTAADLEIQAREIARLREQVDEILHRHTGQPLAKLRTDTERDLILTAQQAVDYGLADRVVTTLKEVPPIS